MRSVRINTKAWKKAYTSVRRTHEKEGTGFPLVLARGSASCVVQIIDAWPSCGREQIFQTSVDGAVNVTSSPRHSLLEGRSVLPGGLLLHKIEEVKQSVKGIKCDNFIEWCDEYEESLGHVSGATPTVTGEGYVVNLHAEILRLQDR
ncbi:hypothetical protein HHK36_024239 [Tetracentron sinense]|uniref:Uncharacterized protein n=1 Tax=Tetracentron sinense TaxID=13715 RepID=A0A834YKI9_TETSI|nr:hypothetical protein HHK36_024239 [Tetracentron sinense]